MAMGVYGQWGMDGTVHIFHDGRDIRGGLSEDEALRWLEGASFAVVERALIFEDREIFDVNGKDSGGSAIVAKFR